jgi:hypothetical protein
MQSCMHTNTRMVDDVMMGMYVLVSIRKPPNLIKTRFIISIPI